MGMTMTFGILSVFSVVMTVPRTVGMRRRFMVMRRRCPLTVIGRPMAMTMVTCDGDPRLRPSVVPDHACATSCDHVRG